MIKECMATNFITTSPGTKLWKFTFTGTTANLPAVYLMDNRENLPVSCFNLPYSSMIKTATADQGSHLWPRQPLLIKAVTSDQGSHHAIASAFSPVQRWGQSQILIHSWPATNYVTQTTVFKIFFLWRGSLACCKEAGLNEYINRSAFLSLTKTQLLLMLHISCILYRPQTFESTKWRPAKANYTSTSKTFGRRQTQTHKNKETALLFMN